MALPLHAIVFQARHDLLLGGFTGSPMKAKLVSSDRHLNLMYSSPTELQATVPGILLGRAGGGSFGGGMGGGYGMYGGYGGV